MFFLFRKTIPHGHTAWFAALVLFIVLPIRAHSSFENEVTNRIYPDRAFVADEYLVKVKSTKVLAELADDFSLEVVQNPLLSTPEGHWFKVVDPSASVGLQDLRAAIYSNYELSDNVLHIERNLVWRASTVGGDPRPQPAPQLPRKSKKDPALGRAYGVLKIQSPEAWTKTVGSERVIVADIDTGIDYNHDDLVNNIWRNSKEIPGDRIDNDGNGFVDDVVGWDFANKDSLPWDDNGHGTHTSGSVGATGGNGVGISGVAQRVSLMGLKFLSGDGSGTTEDAILAINYAVQNGASILSNSWGGDEYSKALEDAIAEAASRNVLFVAAAGNDGTNNDTFPMYPAAYDLPNVIAVAASDQDDKLVDYSNFGFQSVHIVAPGDFIYSTMPGNKYGVNSGTSMACPHVAGAAALLKSLKPNLTPAEIKRLLFASVDKIPEYADKIASGGRLNISRALSLAAGDAQ